MASSTLLENSIKVNEERIKGTWTKPTDDCYMFTPERITQRKKWYWESAKAIWNVPKGIEANDYSIVVHKGDSNGTYIYLENLMAN